ncbi:MAG: hypothetical protein AAF958_00605 [Planctomycetota bacterium]
MDLHERQQFDFLLHTAVERFVARVEERHRGAETALALWNEDSNQAILRDFVDAIFDDFLLTSVDGACFILRSLKSKPCAEAPAEDETIETYLIRLAKSHFSELLGKKSHEALQQHSSYQSI